MPIKKGKSKETFSKNVKEIMESYKDKGSIGSSKPKSKKKAISQALAISYNEQRKGK